MQVNLVVALIRSNQFDQAKKELVTAQKHSSGAALKGIGAFFLLREKKYDEALGQLPKGATDTYSVFLKA
jgi:predicted negative regulator of RcsB-dependent stress response